MLIKFLILFFISLFIYQIYHYLNTFQEGIDSSSDSSSFQSYGKDPSVLVYQNAGNINYLNEQIKKCTTNADEISSLTTQVNNLQKQINSMASAQSSPYTSGSTS
jgi:hypothetical protein